MAIKAYSTPTIAQRTSHYTYKKDDLQHTFRWVNNLPLNGKNPSVRVNVLHYEQADKKGKVIRFSWVTNLELTVKNITAIMRIGRSRWKIENETFNTLKNQGYHFEHNYGHGHHHLSTVLAYLMLLAFEIDQLIQRLYKPFQQILGATRTKVKLWHTQQALFMVQLFQSFQQLYSHIASLFKVQLE